MKIDRRFLVLTLSFSLLMISASAYAKTSKQRFRGPGITTTSGAACGAGGAGVWMADCPSDTALDSTATQCVSTEANSGAIDLRSDAKIDVGGSRVALSWAFIDEHSTPPSCPLGSDIAWIRLPAPHADLEDERCIWAYLPDGFNGTVDGGLGGKVYFTPNNRVCQMPPAITNRNIYSCPTAGATCSIKFKTWLPHATGIEQVTRQLSVSDASYLCDYSIFHIKQSTHAMACYSPAGDVLARLGEQFYIHDGLTCDWHQRPTLAPYSFTLAVDNNQNVISTAAGVTCQDACKGRESASHMCGQTYLGSEPSAGFASTPHDICVCEYRTGDHTYAFDNKTQAICSSGTYAAQAGPDKCTGFSGGPSSGPSGSGGSTSSGGGGLATSLSTSVASHQLGSAARVCTLSEIAAPAISVLCPDGVACCQLASGTMTYKCANGRVQTMPATSTGLYSLPGIEFIAGACSLGVVKPTIGK